MSVTIRGMNAHTVHCTLAECKKLGTDGLGIVVGFEEGDLAVHYIECPWCHGTFPITLAASRIVTVQNKAYKIRGDVAS